MFDINIDMHEIEQPQKKRRAPYGSDRSERHLRLRSAAKELLRKGKAPFVRYWTKADNGGILACDGLSANGRVEERRGSLGHSATLRFLSPLIEPDRQISRIRLSDKTSRLCFRVQRLLQFLNTLWS